MNHTQSKHHPSDHGRSQLKIKRGANFLKLIFSAVFNKGKKLEG